MQEGGRLGADELFISRTGSDKGAALVIARILREAGYTTFLQDEDFGHTSFMARMKEGFDKVESGGRVVALLSRAYQESDYCLHEAHYPLTGDPANKRQRLIVLRIEECAATGFLKSLPYVDLVPLLHDAEAVARAVRGAVDRKAPEADFAALYRRSPTQILHPDIRAVPGFTGREDLLDGIDGALWQKNGTAALINSSSSSAAVKGLGGVGKSVLAREYAWRARERYHGVWWVRAETKQTLNDDLIDLGSRLIHNLKEVQERDRALHLALDAIARAGDDKPWLIVFDNVEKPGDIARLTPKTSAHILITSRWPRWQGHAQELPVDVFPEATAMDFLLAERPHETREAAGRLAAALGHLPLALSHARAYCAETNLSFDDYARRLSELIQEAPEDAEYPATVFATFSLAIAKATEACPEAEKLMEIAAFLAPERIPLDIIITENVMSEKQREKAIAALFRVSLITHEMLENGARAFSVHRLAQEISRAQVGSRRAQLLKLTTHSFLASIGRDKEPYETARSLLLQARALAEQMKNDDDLVISAALQVVIEFGYNPFHMHPQTRVVPALKKIAEKFSRTNTPHITEELNEIASIYKASGMFYHVDDSFIAADSRHDVEVAHDFYARVLAIREKELGPDHLCIAEALVNLADIRQMHNAMYVGWSGPPYYDVELLYKRAAAIREKASSADSPDVSHQPSQPRPPL